MATTIPGAIGRIKNALDAHFDSKGFEWKTRESQDVHEQAIPTVFAMVCADRTADNWPTICPSITIELKDASVMRDAVSLNIVCHCVVVNSAILQREKAVMLDDGIHYVYQDVDGYTEEGVVEALFSDCLLLGEETLNAIRGLSGVSDLALVPPSSLDDFPYCQCQVIASVSMLTQFVQEDLL